MVEVKDTTGFKSGMGMQIYVEMGLTTWETVAAETQGVNSFREAKKDVGDSLVLIGNIDQINFLKTATTKQVEDKVEEFVGIGKSGGKYIFAASDFLEKDTPLENIIAAIKTVKRCRIYEK